MTIMSGYDAVTDTISVRFYEGKPARFAAVVAMATELLPVLPFLTFSLSGRGEEGTLGR